MKKPSSRESQSMVAKHNEKSNDLYWMSLAYQQALKAQEHDEVPVGAVVVSNEQLIASGYNSPISSNDPSAHAEVNAVRNACELLENYRLTDATLYVTLEPCTMCLGLLIHSRVRRLVYAAPEPKAGVVNSRLTLLDEDFYNHKIECRSGVLVEQCSELLSNFFHQRRKR
jgi:tRNA(Arg) A34 adenosine deaminase TadA